MKKRIGFIVISSILFIAVAIIAVRLFMENQELKSDIHEIVQSYVTMIDKNKNRINYLDKKETLQLVSEGNILNPNLVLSTQEGKGVRLNEILSRNNKLFIIRYSEYDCYSCYENFWPILKDYQNKNPKTEFILMANYNNIRDLGMFIKRIDFEGKTYIIEEKLDLPIEKFDIPYFFILKNNGTCQNVYAIDKGNLFSSHTILSDI